MVSPTYLWNLSSPLHPLSHYPFFRSYHLSPNGLPNFPFQALSTYCHYSLLMLWLLKPFQNYSVSYKSEASPDLAFGLCASTIPCFLLFASQDIALSYMCYALSLSISISLFPYSYHLKCLLNPCVCKSLVIKNWFTYDLLGEPIMVESTTIVKSITTPCTIIYISHYYN